MTIPVDPNGVNQRSKQKRPARRRRVSLSPITFGLLIAVIIVLLLIPAFFILQTRFGLFPDLTLLGAEGTQPEIAASSTSTMVNGTPENTPRPTRTAVPPEQAGLLTFGASLTNA